MGRLLFDKEIWKKIWVANWFYLNPDDDSADWKDVWNPWFFAVAGHHGTPPEKTDAPLSTLFEEGDRESAMLFTEVCSRMFLMSRMSANNTFSEKDLLAFSRKSWLLAGFAVMCDWIGSNNYQFPHCSAPMPPEKYWNEYAVPNAEKAIRNFGLLPGTASTEIGMNVLFPEISTPTPLQSFAETCELPPLPQMFIIEEATGSGKTEAALVLAHRLMALGLGEGMYFGLPTMATANAMYDRMGKAYERLFSPDSHPSIILAHGGRHLSEKFRQSIVYNNHGNEQVVGGEVPASAYCTAWLADNRKKALLAQVGVGTIDQALMAVLPLHHQSLRILGLSRNILIVDEVHAFDPYVERILISLLEFQAALGGSVILISATLPMAQRQALLSAYSSGLGFDCSQVRESHYPLVTRVTAQTKEPTECPIQICEMTHRTIEVECTDDKGREIRELSHIIDDGHCACWINNTVDDAIETYRTLSEKFGAEHVLLFHARFTMGDRIEKENEVLKLFGKDSTPDIRNGKILVATQVVEQSLDLDFDFMVTDLAPMDLIIQRVGRLHRHNDPAKRGNRGVPRLAVMSPPVLDNPDSDWYSAMFPKGQFVYPSHGQLWLTVRLLSDRKKITMPDDARLLIEGTFGPEAQRQIPETLIEQEIKAEGKRMADGAIAQLNVLHLNGGYAHTPNPWQDDARTPTRLGARVTILLLKWENSNLHFFSPDPMFSEEFSQVSISDNKISKEFPYTGELAVCLDAFKTGLADKGKWRILVPLEWKNDAWQGRCLDRNNKVVSVWYDSYTGLLTNKT